jgi:hypothetical protein
MLIEVSIKGFYYPLNIGIEELVEYTLAHTWHTGVSLAEDVLPQLFLG